MSGRARDDAPEPGSHIGGAPLWLRVGTLVLAALALTTTSAHVLELPAKLRYDAAFYTAVNGTLYRQFATVGVGYCLGVITAACGLAVRTRREPGVRWWALAGASCFVLWLASWAALVAPVNARVAAALRTAPADVPALWLELRGRWEYGHAAGFVLQLLGFTALAVSVVRDASARAPGTAAPVVGGVRRRRAT